MGKRREQFSEAEIVDWFTQMCEGVKFMHERGVTHGHIESNNVYLTDQGVVKIDIPTDACNFHGRVNLKYLAPELLNAGQIER